VLLLAMSAGGRSGPIRSDDQPGSDPAVDAHRPARPVLDELLRVEHSGPDVVRRAASVCRSGASGQSSRTVRPAVHHSPSPDAGVWRTPGPDAVGAHFTLSR
jgi:hypothetical protein